MSPKGFHAVRSAQHSPPGQPLLTRLSHPRIRFDQGLRFKFKLKIPGFA